MSGELCNELCCLVIMIRGTASSGGDWKDIYRLLITSLRTSSVHFQQLGVESLTVGLWGLSKKHAATQIDPLPGKQISPERRSQVTEWVYLADVLLRTFGGAGTAADVARSLGVQESSVLHFQPHSAPLLPAHAIIVDADRKQLLLLVRGTSSWADCLTDIVAHTEQLGAGRAHSGMLDCARRVLQHCVPILQQQLQATPGYKIHCLGHSLGGGVASLAAYLIHTTPELREQLAAASGVMATGFGTPPVLSQELAEAVGAFTRTLVHNCDLVPRTCVASLALLRAQLEAEKDAVYASSSLLSSLKSSGVLEGGVSLLGSVCAAAMANKLVPGTGTGAAGSRSRWMSAGLQVGANLLLNKAREMHQEAMGPSGATLGAGGAGNKSAAGTVKSQQPAAAAQANPQTDAAAQGANAGVFSFAAMRQAVTAAVAAPAAAMNSGTEPLAVSEQQQQPAAADEFRSSIPQSPEQRFEEEEQAEKHFLYCPGQLWHLRRSTSAGVSPGGECSYELVQAVEPRADRFGGKIWIKRSMLTDHYLSEHMQALLQLQAQLVEQAAQAAA